MWVVDLVIAIQRAKQRKEEPPRWTLNIMELLRRRHERKIKQRAENVKRKL
jgi:hypothetical protein